LEKKEEESNKIKIYNMFLLSPLLRPLSSLLESLKLIAPRRGRGGGPPHSLQFFVLSLLLVVGGEVTSVGGAAGAQATVSEEYQVG
jgi:hypothetical protein